MKTLKKFITEGGNVFKGKTSSIPIDYIEPTLTTYFNELKKIFPKKSNIFNLQHFHTLGSVGKKAISGDIDLAIDAKDILDDKMSPESMSLWGVDPAEVHNDFLLLSKRVKTSTPEQLVLKAFLKQVSKKINKAGYDISCDEKKITAGNMFSMFPQFDASGKKLTIGVQIDWMVGNLQWLKFSYYSAAYPPESNVKGLHRTQLMLAAFQQAGLSFNHTSGVKDKKTGEVITQDPDKALKELSSRLGLTLTHSNIEDYFKLHAYLKKNMKPLHYSGMIDTYFRILDSTRADIPDDLQDEWLKRKSRLNLTGKFLPDNSALKGK